MYKKFIVPNNVSSYESLKMALKTLPGVVDHTEEGMGGNLRALKIFGFPVFFEYNKIYLTKEKSGYSAELPYTNVFNMYYTDKYICALHSDDRTVLIAFLKTIDGVLIFIKGSFFMRFRNETKRENAYNFYQNAILVQPELNQMYKRDFVAPFIFENYEGQAVWGLRPTDAIHENIQILNGYTNIVENSIFRIGEEDWICLSSIGRSLLAVKKV